MGRATKEPKRFPKNQLPAPPHCQKDKEGRELLSHNPLSKEKKGGGVNPYKIVG